MKGVKRRDFLGQIAGAAAYIGGSRLLGGSNASVPPPPPPQVQLGKTGVKLSRVGQGTGMHGGGHQSDHTRMGFEKLVALFRHGYDRGITFFDMADLYGTHYYFREALRFIPREKVTILTKLWWRTAGRRQGKFPDSFRRKWAEMALERFRQELTTDYLDIVLLHCVSSPNWDQELEPYMEALSKAKEQKKIRAVGVSCHGLGAVNTAAESPWVDVVLARINPRGARTGGPPEKVIPVLKRVKKNGKAVIGMKIYGEGRLTDNKEECIRFAQNLGLLDAMTIGTEKPSEIDENLKLLAKYPAAKVETG